MMKKLLKYDMKSGLRIFGFAWLGIAVLTGLVCLIFALGSEDSVATAILGVIGLFPMIFGIMGAMMYSNIFVALRFYNGLLAREGYLMFTLPTTPWKLLTSKLISAVVFVGGTTLLSIGSVVAILAAAVNGFGIDLQYLTEVFGIEFKFSWTMVAMLAGQLVSIISGILQIYLACCLGHLCKGKRVLFAVLFYFVINTVISFIASVLQMIFAAETVGSLSVLVEGALYYTIPFDLGISLLCFFLCEWILRTKLNLE